MVLYYAKLTTKSTDSMKPFCTPRAKTRTSFQNLVAVLVAQRGARGVEDIPNADRGPHIIDIDRGIEGEGVSSLVVAGDAGGAGRVGVLPDAEVAVDEGVVQPEDRVGRRCVDVLHDGSDTVVTPGVRPSLSAISHAVEIAESIALVDVGRVAVGRLGAVAGTSKTMELVA